jgi:hypothetical protein
VNSNSWPGARPITRATVSFWMAKLFFAWINCCCRVWSSTLVRRPSMSGEVPAFDLVRCLIVERLRRLHLRFCRFDAGFVGDGL